MRKVCILLGTYNGEKYLREQLDSIYAQDYKNLFVFVRDDGSKDSTIQILEEYKNEYGLQYLKGENIGAFPNFIELIRLAPKSDYYAYADQDDVWLEDKISKAIMKIERKDTNKPTLYFGSHIAVSMNLEKLPNGKLKDFKEIENLALGTMRNICQGSTCVFNNCLMKELKKMPKNISVAHDWWTYLVCMSLKGNIIADNEAYLLYRQHDSNVLGANITLRNRIIRRSKMIFGKRTHEREYMCRNLLEIYGEKLDEKTYNTLKEVTDYRSSWRTTLQLLTNKDFYKGGWEYSISFVTAVLTRVI